MSNRLWLKLGSFMAIPLLLLFFVLPGSVNAQTVTRSQARIPFVQCVADGYLFEPGCDGLKPPPLVDCNNDSTLNWKEIYDHNGSPMGKLYLFHSNLVTDCGSSWGAVLDDAGACFTVNFVGIYETTSDRSAYLGINGYDQRICKGQWSSTFMVGQTHTDCAYAHSQVTDWAGVGLLITNTNTVCPG